MSDQGEHLSDLSRYFADVPTWNGIQTPLRFGIASTTVDKLQPSGNLPVIRLNSWRSLSELLEHKFFAVERKNWIFRGHRRFDWSLSPTLGRETDGVVYQELALKQLDRFRKAVRGRLKDNSILLNGGEFGEADNELELWALGQHHGLQTPLLDWTHSPYVALFFAFAENDDQYEKENPCRVIYALNKEAIRDDSVFPDIEVVEPKIDDHGRLVNQAGLFVKSPYGNTIENEIINLLGQNEIIDVDDPNALAQYICKIYIANDELTECRNALREMNIHYASLFPDLIGASLYCNTDVAEDNMRLALESGALERIMGIRLDTVRTPKGTLAGDEEANVSVEVGEPEVAAAVEGEAARAAVGKVSVQIEEAEGQGDLLSYLSADDPLRARLEPLLEKIKTTAEQFMLVDWEHKETVQAAMRKEIRRMLRLNDFEADESQEVAKDIVAHLVVRKQTNEAYLGQDDDENAAPAEAPEGDN